MMVITLLFYFNIYEYIYYYNKDVEGKPLDFYNSNYEIYRDQVSEEDKNKVLAFVKNLRE